MLKEYLDKFYSTYIDNILIYINSTKEEYQDYIRKVLIRLQDTGLQLDINKYKFRVTSIKYLGFIIKAGIGI